MHIYMIRLHVYSTRICMEAGEPGILITHGFFNRWYFAGSISSPGSGFTGPIGASSGKSAGGFCGERSCLTRGGSREEGVMEEKNGRGVGGGESSSHFISVSQSLSLTGLLCFLLMNSLQSVLKRRARVLLCPRARIRGLMASLTNSQAAAHFTLYNTLIIPFRMRGRTPLRNCQNGGRHHE